MKNSAASIMISPSQVFKNTSLHVKTSSGAFTDKEYFITDEQGRVVRKGSVSERISEFTLSMVGIKTGVYRFVMGAVQQKFVVVL